MEHLHLVKNRVSLRTKATEITKSIEEARRRENIEEDDLAYLIFTGENLIKAISVMQEELDNLEVYDETKHLELLTEQLFKASRMLKRMELKPTDARTEADERKTSPFIEPKASMNITIPKFDGDLMAWSEFNEIFNSFIHNNARYSDAEKLYLLKTNLGGEAARAVESIAYTTEGYLLARSILNERFNQTEKRREAILGKLMSIPAVTDDGNLKDLRLLIDEVSSHVRILERALTCQPIQFHRS